VYERKKATAQSKGKKDLYEKYVARERNREKDFVNKLVAGLRIHSRTLFIFSRILIRRISCLGRGLRIGGRGMLEHHGKEYIEECQK
jgi:hypothetical protein